MSADPETLRAIHALSVSITAKFDERARDSAEQARRIYDRIDRHSDEARDSFKAHAKEIGEITTGLGKLRLEFDRHVEDHGDNSDDRKGWLRLTAAGVVGGFATWVARHFGGGAQ